MILRITQLGQLVLCLVLVCRIGPMGVAQEPQPPAAAVEPEQREKTTRIHAEVTVPGSTAVPLRESAGNTGWSEIPAIARRALIFELKRDQPNGGVLKFRVDSDGLVVLAASWAYDGNGGGWQKESLTREELVKSGWHEAGTMYLNLSDRHTLFVRKCRKGEQFSIRTRKYNRPLLLLPGALDVAPRRPAPVRSDARFGISVLGAIVRPRNELVAEDKTPRALLGTTAFESPLRGVAILQVHEPTLVYVAASWGHDGNRSGQWTEERWTEEAFREQGWKEVGPILITHRGREQDHRLFVRPCSAGERFRFRTRKYGAPVIFARPNVDRKQDPQSGQQRDE